MHWRGAPHTVGMSGDQAVRAERAVAAACETAGSVVELCRDVRAAIDPVVPSDRWCAFAVDPATLFATNGYHDEGVDERVLPRLMEIEHGEADRNQLPELARTPGGVATLSSVLDGDLARSPRWRDVLQPSGMAHELRAAFRSGETVWGALVLMRGTDLPDFSAAEVGFLRAVSSTIADGFRRVLLRQHLDHGEDVREAGVVLLTGRPPRLQMATPAAQRWLDELDDGGLSGGLPTPVISAAQGARVASSGTVAVRARTRSGRWVTITAERTGDGAEEGAPGDEPIGLVIQPSRPAEIAQIVSAAHGLTPRERDIVLLVAAGHTNTQIARVLGVSAYTVGDHLKSIFAKVDVASRGELTSRLFFDHHLPRVSSGAPAGVDGWFLPE